MSDDTARLHLAQLLSLQELNAVTWNEALASLDAMVDLYLLGQFVNTPPASPQDGDVYLIGGAPTGAWSGYPYKLAAALDGGWRIHMPFNGLRAYVAPTAAFLLYLNGVWSDCSALISANEISIASAATCDLGAANALFVQVTGTTTITSFGSGTSKLRYVRFAQNLTLTHNATSLILLGGASRITAAGDLGVYASDGSGNWRERQYWRAATNPGDVATKSGTETLTGKTLGATGLPGNGAITASGWIGIGTSPSYGLHVETGSIKINNGITGAGQSGTIYLADGSFTKAYGGGWTFNGGMQVSGGLGLSSLMGDIRPYYDNTNAMGVAAYRWSVVYAGTGTINTSGRTTKTAIRALNQAEIAVARALARSVRVFQFIDAVAKKGDAARFHVGMVYEDVVAAFAAEGLDAMQYGIVCRDPAMTAVEKVRTVSRPKSETVAVQVERVSVEDGHAVLRLSEERREVPVVARMTVVDDTGQPVLAADGTPRFHDEPVMECVEERFLEDVPDRDAAGQPKWILGLRYSELAQFLVAGMAS